VNGHLELDLAAAMQDDPLDRIRASVTEPDMTAAEVDAAVEDALARLGIARPPEATTAPRCICDGGSLLLDALAVDRTCARCAREPR
jgi:hypothetical protein